MVKELKRRKLIRKLFDKIKSDFDFKGIFLSLRIANYSSSNKMINWTRENRVYKITIVLNLGSIENRIKKGYSGYYKNRTSKVNPFIINNRHNVYRFILLHEITHADDLINKFGLRQWRLLSEKTKEIRADNYALLNLKRY